MVSWKFDLWALFNRFSLSSASFSLSCSPPAGVFTPNIAAEVPGGFGVAAEDAAAFFTSFFRASAPNLSSLFAFLASTSVLALPGPSDLQSFYVKEQIKKFKTKRELLCLSFLFFISIGLVVQSESLCSLFPFL